MYPTLAMSLYSVKLEEPALNIENIYKQNPNQSVHSTLLSKEPVRELDSYPVTVMFSTLEIDLTNLFTLESAFPRRASRAAAKIDQR